MSLVKPSLYKTLLAFCCALSCVVSRCALTPLPEHFYITKLRHLLASVSRSAEGCGELWVSCRLHSILAQLPNRNGPLQI